MGDRCRYCDESIIVHETKGSTFVWLHTQRTHAAGSEFCLDGEHVAEPVVFDE